MMLLFCKILHRLNNIQQQKGPSSSMQWMTSAQTVGESKTSEL